MNFRNLLLCVLILNGSAGFSLFPLVAADLAVTGNLSVTGRADIDTDLDVSGNTFSFGSLTSSPTTAGLIMSYTDGVNGVLTFSLAAASNNWIWQSGTSPQLKLDTANILTLYAPGASTPAITLNPSGVSTFSSGLTVNGAFSAQNYIATEGIITGAMTGLTLNSGGTNENITLAPSGTGVTTTAAPVSVTDATASSSETTGALVVTGGVGVGGTVNANALTAAGTVSGATVRATGNTASTSTTTGSLIVYGGAGVWGAVNAGSFTTSGAVSARSLSISGDVAVGTLTVGGARVPTNNASGSSALSLDDASAWGDSSVALGFLASASADLSMALGPESEAQGFSSVALGYQAYAQSQSSIAIGQGSYAQGGRSAALGDRAYAFGLYSTALGSEAKAYGVHSTALGNANSQAYGSVAMGYYNVLQGQESVWIETDDLLVVGNGTGYYYSSNAFVIHKNGNTRVAGKVEAKQGFRTPPMGDIGMGSFVIGDNPGDALTGLNLGLRYPSE